MTPQLPPGPRRARLLRGLNYGLNPWGAAPRMRARYGDSFTLAVPGLPPMVVLGHPDEIRDFFSLDPEVAIAGEANQAIFEAFLGRNPVLHLDGSNHRRRRLLLQGPFLASHVTEFGNAIREITHGRIRGWKTHRPFDVYKEMGEITIQVIVRVIFGVDDRAQQDEARAAILALLERSYRPSFSLLALSWFRRDLGSRSPWGAFLRARQRIYNVIEASIARRRSLGTEGRTDVLSMLLDARGEDGEALTGEELRDELFTLMMVGHETTAATLAWAMWAILSNPEVHSKVLDELEETRDEAPLDIARLSRKTYLGAVIQETLRLYPVTDGAARMLREPATVGRLHLPAGVLVTTSTILSHTHPEIWSDPMRFDPERYLTGERMDAMAMTPFGGGRRRCLGASFAAYEMRVVLAEMLRHADLTLVPGYRAKPFRRAITVAPKGGVPVIARSVTTPS